MEKIRIPNILYLVVGVGVTALVWFRRKTKRKIKGFEFFAKQSEEHTKRKHNARNTY